MKTLSNVQQLLLALSSAMLFSATCFGQNNIEYSPVIVTAKRMAADDIDTEFQTGHVTVISRDEFEGDVATVADVLRKETGIQIRQLGGLGSFSSVSIRGASSAQVNIYLDGILLNGAYGGTVDLSQFLLSSVEQIEIYRGNVPVQLGQAGIGGAIHIKTLRSDKKSEKLATLGIGSFATKKLSASLGDHYRATDYRVAGEYLASKNDYDLINNNSTPSNHSDDFPDRRHNAGFEQFSGLLSAAHLFDQKHSLQFIGQISTKEQGVPEVTNDPTTKTSFKTDFSSIQFKLNRQHGPGTSLAARVFASERKELFDDTQDRKGLGANKEEGITDSFGGGLQASHSLSSHLFNLNVEGKSENYKNSDLLKGKRTEYERVSATFGLQDEWVDSAGKWLVNMGARSYFTNDQLKRNGLRENDWHHGFHSGVLFHVTDHVQFQTNFSSDIRLPQLNEKYGDRGFSIGNDKLVPEEALNADVGVRFNFGTLNSSATYFHRDLENAILTIFDSRGTGRAENTSQSEIQGFEFEAGYSFTDDWQALLRSTVQDSKDLSDSRDFRGHSLPGLYDVSGYISNTVRHDKLQFTLEYQYQSGGFYDRSDIEEMPDIKQVNFISTWSSHGRVIEVHLENISDQRVEDFHRYPGPGRRVLVTYKQSY